MNAVPKPARFTLSRNAFVILWLGLAVLLVGVHYDFLFLQPHTEIGDYGVNALQIRNAKFGRELYGHYCRFGFNHPGPLFFYCYAIGEWLLYDLLKAVPSEFNAHIITGIFLQCGFFVWSLAIVYHHSKQALIVPVLLVLAAIHFGFVNHGPMRDSVFASIWPPHMLLFPFVCFLVGCASLASGRFEDILPAVGSGCFLVHGHVAQPLFVLPIFTVAALVFLRQHHWNALSLKRVVISHRVRSVITAVVLAASILPLLIDATKGADSNVHAIFSHLSTVRDDHKTLAQSLLYLIHFTWYEPNPERYCDQLDGRSFDSLKTYWKFAATWAVILVVNVGLMIRRKGTAKRFRMFLSAGVLFSFFLCVCWGVMQSGPMFSYNSHFSYGLFFLLLANLVLAVHLELSPRLERALVFCAFALAVPLLVGTAKSWYSSDDLRVLRVNSTLMPDLPAAAEASSSRTKYLYFDRDNWGWAAAVAVDLQRHGYDYFVRPDFALEFGRENTRDIMTAISQRLPVWRFGPPSEALQGFRVNYLDLRAGSPRKIDPSGGRIMFGQEGRTAKHYALTGWDFASDNHAWTVERTAVLYFQTTKTDRDVVMSIDLSPAILPGVPAQRLEVNFDDSLRATYKLAQPETVTLLIPAAAWNQDRPVFIRFDFPDAKSPREDGRSADPRSLGCAFRSIKFEQAR